MGFKLYEVDINFGTNYKVAITTPDCIIILGSPSFVIAEDTERLERCLRNVCSILGIDCDVDEVVSKARYISTVESVDGMPSTLICGDDGGLLPIPISSNMVDARRAMVVSISALFIGLILGMLLYWG